MVIVGHGKRSKDIEKSETSGLSAWENAVGVTFAHLRHAVSVLSNGGLHPVRIVCLTCYGGGIHYLSRELNNVCTAATAPFLMRSLSAPIQSEFLTGLLDQLSDSKQSHTFAEAVISGYAKDAHNMNLGQISSFDYLDFIFKRGPYNPKLAEQFKKFKGIPRTSDVSNHDSILLDSFILDTFDRQSLPPEYRSPSVHTLGREGNSCEKAIVSPNVALLQLIDDVKTATAVTAPAQSAEHPGKKYRRELERIQEAHHLPDKFIKLLLEELEDLSAIPLDRFNEEFKGKIRAYQVQEKDLLDDIYTLKQNEVKIKNLEDQRVRLQPEQSEIGGKRKRDDEDVPNFDEQIKGLKVAVGDKDSGLISQIAKKYKALSDLNDKQIFKYARTLSRFHDLKRVFSGTEVNKKEKEKFKSLLHCEWDQEI